MGEFDEWAKERGLVQLADTVIPPHQTWGGVLNTVLASNNRDRDLRVVVFEYVPPPPSPKCGAYLSVNDGEYWVALCELDDAHEGPHRANYSGWVIEYRSPSSDG